MKKHWISCRTFTVQVNTDSAGKIIFAAPIVRRFLGQPIDRLLAWAGRFGHVRYELLH